MRATILAIAWLALASGSARAGDHTYAGVWGEAGVEDVQENPEFFGANSCYNKFTEQLPDGRFKYYLVDHAKWVGEKKIEYLLAQEGTCTVAENGKSEKCVGTVIGETPNEWFIAFDGKDAGILKANYYENVFYFEKRFNGVPLVRHQCPFDMAAIKPFISGRTIADCTTRCRAFGQSEAADFREMITAIKAGK